MPSNFPPDLSGQLTVSDEMKKPPKNFDTGKILPKSTETVNSFKGSSKLTKQASKAYRKH